MSSWLISAVFVLLVVVSSCTGATDVSLLRNMSENAYATIFYEGTPRDYEYFLGARVAMYSFKKAGSRQDRVVFISDNVRQEWRDIFEGDGLRVVQVENLANPYTADVRYLSRFKYSLNKLYGWALTQYRRVIMVDADVIAVKNADELFLCGHFCALFLNPCHFHTGLFVLKPEKFEHMLRDLQATPSHDAADQGFLDNEFHDLADAPLFDPRSGISERTLERLSIGYNMHHLYYYEKFNWDLYSCSPIVTLGYPIAQHFKPWYWWGYPLLDLHALWQDLRAELPHQDHHYAARGTLAIGTLVVAFLILKYGMCFRPTCEPLLLSTHTLPTSLMFGFLASLLSVRLSSELVPGWLPPMPGWLLFGAFYTIFFYFLVCSLGLYLFTCSSRYMPSTSLKHHMLVTAFQRLLLMTIPVYLLCFSLLAARIYGNIIYKAAAALTSATMSVVLQSLVCWQVVQVFLKPENQAEPHTLFGRGCKV